MALKHLLATSLSLGVLAHGCQDVAVCEDEALCSPIERSRGGEGGGDAGDDGAAGSPGIESGGDGGRPSPPPAGGAGGGSGAGGDTSAAGEGGDAGAGAAGACSPGFGECDGSSLTICETPLDHSMLHCGRCGRLCEGTCALGHCREPELVFDVGEPEQFVATQVAGFAVVPSFSGQGQWLYRFDLIGDAAPAQLAEVLDWEASLALGPDKVYLRDGDLVRAVGLAGQSVETEAIGPVRSFGASPLGSYYVSVDYEDDETEVSRLWFRPAHAADWQLLHEGEPLELAGSGPAGVAALFGSEYDDERSLALLEGGEIVPLGTLPEDWSSLRVTADAVAVLVAESRRLWWFAAGAQPFHYGVGEPSYDDAETLRASPEGVAMQIRDGSRAFVQEFSRSGALPWKIGVRRAANLVFLDRSYVWYTHSPSWSELNLLRSRQVEISDL